ncbi:MAG: hypothetical protein ACRCX8_12855 [Sarcina sp.]
MKWVDKEYNGKNITTCVNNNDGFQYNYSYYREDGVEIQTGSYEIYKFSEDRTVRTLVDRGRYRKGNRTGTRFIYALDKDGNQYLYATIEYRAGKRSGASYGFYPNGAIRFIMNYSGNKIVGTAVSFSDDGKLLTSISTTTTNRTTEVLERNGIHRTSSRVVHGNKEYKELLVTLKKYFRDVWYK